MGGNFSGAKNVGNVKRLENFADGFGWAKADF